MKCKKLGVLLAMVLVGVSASPTWTVSAAESQDLPQQVLDISNGSDEIYGPGAPIEHVENPDERLQDCMESGYNNCTAVVTGWW